MGFTVDSRSLSVATGVKVFDNDLGGDADLARSGVSEAAALEVGLEEDVPFG